MPGEIASLGAGVAGPFNFQLNKAFNFMLPILAGYIAMSIADRSGLAAGFGGGWMAKQGYTLGYLSTVMDSEAQAALVSGGFLGALLAGFVAGYLMLGIERALEKLPSSIEGIKPILLYPVPGVFLTGLIMMGVNPIMGAINSALSGFLNGLSGSSMVLLGIIVAGMQATDMGGSVNKAAYVFGTATLAEQTLSGNMIMAAVMAGGMVPPLPACILGSATAGGLSMLFGCASPAPHGGAWVIAVIANPVQYLIALFAGAAVGCLVLSLLKKPLPPEQSGLAK
ncbi:PTS fructose transporter subunit IIC [Enorma phocaeensis]|uniref:PTS fructose transporter subunit IIC n=1 Tax=Enorma phocaeensis TaxID=1871019 RepID=UPI00320AB70D